MKDFLKESFRMERVFLEAARILWRLCVLENARGKHCLYWLDSRAKLPLVVGSVSLFEAVHFI